MPNLTPHATRDDTRVLRSYLPIPDVPVPGFELLVVNSYLIKYQQPFLMDTGVPIVEDEFLESLWFLIDPQGLRWIFLTHNDGDLTGTIDEVMAAAPKPR